MTWTREEAREQAYRERNSFECDLRCRECKDEYVGEVFEGEPDACPSCDSEDVERVW